ncbi:fimbrial-like adhesin protein [Escherichia coli]|nr:fimbrial-like adhesin protein [Escherichia coli]SRY84201.1 fimbrial-like adhesin protein [Escherichia coli]VDG91945.1 fimbrial-like protein [Shigella dysenteriae]
MKKSVLTAFITVVCATSSVMAADDNAITDGKVTFNGKVIAPACTLVAATKDSVVTLPNVSATKLQTNGAVSGVKTDVPIALEGCDVTVTKNATVDSIGQRNSYVKTWGCGGFLNETNIYSRGKSLCF